MTRSEIIENPNDWFPVVSSTKQGDYFDRLKVTISMDLNSQGSSGARSVIVDNNSTLNRKDSMETIPNYPVSKSPRESSASYIPPILVTPNSRTASKNKKIDFSADSKPTSYSASPRRNYRKFRPIPYLPPNSRRDRNDSSSMYKSIGNNGSSSKGSTDIEMDSSSKQSKDYDTINDEDEDHLILDDENIDDNNNCCQVCGQFLFYFYYFSIYYYHEILFYFYFILIIIIY